MPHALAIDRMTSRYLVPRDQLSVEPLAARLDGIAAGAVPRALAAILGAIASSADESVWVIPRLEIAVDVDVAWDAERLARCWAIELARHLARLLAAGGAGDVVRFEDRAEYLATFVADLADGRAWNRDWYRAFDGLKMLPASAAIRTVLADAAEPPLAALARLSASALQRTITALSTHDAAVVVHRLLPAALDGVSRAAMGHALSVWQNNRDRLEIAGAERRAIWWIARIRASASPELADADVTTAAGAIVWLDTTAATAADDRRALAIERLSRDDVGHLVDETRWPPPAYGRVWLEHPDLLDEAQAPFNAIAPASRAAGRSDASAATAFGAVFWLLPLLDSMPAEDWTEQAQAFRFAVFARCCAPDVRASVWHDAYVRDLFAMPPDAEEADDDQVSADAVDHWMAAQDHPAFDRPVDDEYFGAAGGISLAAHAVMRLFAWKLAGFGAASPAHLWRNCLCVPARVDAYDDRIVARIARPPLDVVLRLAGLFHTSYCLPRFDARRIEIMAGD